MRPVEYVEEAFRVLFRRPLRTILTMLGIMIGVASVVLIGVISQYGSDMLNSEMEALGLSSLTIRTENADYSPLGEEELNVIRDAEGVEELSPIMMKTGTLCANEQESEAMLWGVSDHAANIISLQVTSGRLLCGRDCTEYRNVCLIDESFSKEAFGTTQSAGQTVQIQLGKYTYSFMVAGVVKTGTGLLQNFLSSYIPNFIYIPYTTLQLYSGGGGFDQIAVKIDGNSSADTVGEELVATLNQRTGLSGYLAGNLVGQKQSLTNILDLCTLIFSAVGGISLLVASLSIMTIMFISVQERKQEIGIKKALGASRGRIMMGFLTEALLLSGMGSAAGVTIGLLLSGILSLVTGITIHLRPEIICAAVIVSILSAILFTLWPAKRAADLHPVDALRTQ